MLEQDRRSYFSLVSMSAAMMVIAGGGVFMPATLTQSPFQTYETSGYEASGAHPTPVEGCLDDNPNPPLSCL
jgi:hypothetical protein